MKIILSILLVWSIAPSTSFAQMTAEKARSLPLNDLAHRLLGESGSIMIDVDRPRYKNILEPLRFYSHAFAWGSFFGVCASDWVTVEFNEKGFVGALRSERRYGVAGDMYGKSSKWTYDAFGKMCASVKSTKGYFPAPDHSSAWDIARYVHAISGVGPFTAQKFSYKCTGLCGEGRRDLDWLRLGNISSSRIIACPKTSLKLPSCYEVVVGYGRIGTFPKTFRVYGSNFMNKTIVSQIAVDVQSTLQ
jgi:hypothetical protein